jgi:pimeloyl-ACP methyl ester carboxylesterase
VASDGRAHVTDELVLDLDGRETRVLRAGSGEPTIVWLHDTLGNGWSAAHERLSRSYSLVAPSLPGFEDSATLDGIDAPEDVVFWLVDLLDELGLQRAVLLGCGLGGWMAAEFAVRHPARVERLILVDAYGLRVEGALAADEFALTPGKLRPLLFAEGESALAHEMRPDQPPVGTLERSLHARVAGARLAWQFPYDRKLIGRLHRATVRSLVVWGEQDRLVPLAHGAAYTRGLPDARLEGIAEAGHYPYLELPDLFGEVVEAFINRG